MLDDCAIGVDTAANLINLRVSVARATTWAPPKAEWAAGACHRVGVTAGTSNNSGIMASLDVTKIEILA